MPSRPCGSQAPCFLARAPRRLRRGLPRFLDAILARRGQPVPADFPDSSGGSPASARSTRSPTADKMMTLRACPTSTRDGALDFSLVDPDTGAPSISGQRRGMLAAMPGRIWKTIGSLSSRHDGIHGDAASKMFLIWRALSARRRFARCSAGGVSALSPRAGAETAWLPLRGAKARIGPNVVPRLLFPW